MCNRYAMAGRLSTEEIIVTFQLTGELLLPKSTTVWPLYQGLIVRARSDGGPGREAALAQWGLVPHWAPDMKFDRNTNNARAETIATKPSFRAAYKSRRCLIPAANFCEIWKKVWYEFTIPSQPMFAMAGLWETWGPKESPQESYTMITTEANSLVAEYHAKQRMPVLLDPEDYDLWLTGAPEKSATLLRTYPAEKMKVSELVG
jgi:putative SOS response-associated peptidase YedK